MVWSVNILFSLAIEILACSKDVEHDAKTRRMLKEHCQDIVTIIQITNNKLKIKVESKKTQVIC